VLTDYRLQGNRSLVDVARHVAQIKATFGGQRAVTLTAQRIKEYTEQRLAAGYARASVNRELAVIRRMFSLAIQESKLTAAHRPYVKMLKEQNARAGFGSTYGSKRASHATVTGTVPHAIDTPSAQAVLPWRPSKRSSGKYHQSSRAKFSIS